MHDQGPITALQMVDSLTNWWELAGVDTIVCDNSVDWLALDLKAEEVARPVVEATAAKVSPEVPKPEWPLAIEPLKAAIAARVDLPGNQYGTRSVVPAGPPTCEIMVISDFPEMDEMATRILGSGMSGKLLHRMLASIGVDLNECYWTSLAFTAPASGEVPERDIPELAAFVRHQVAMVKPSWIILLGTLASSAILELQLMDARQSLRDFNHDGAKVAVLTTFHPRTLIARPQLKAQAWKDLQMFSKGNIL